MTKLADRIKDRMESTGLTNAGLARAARVQPPTAHNWGSGKTKAIKGEPLLRAAAALGVTPEWLATGKGKKFPDPNPAPNLAQEPSKPYCESDDPWICEAVDTLLQMSADDRRAAVLNLRVFRQSLGAPRHSKNLSVAA